jgi:hypothetical protein
MVMIGLGVASTQSRNKSNRRKGEKNTNVRVVVFGFLMCAFLLSCWNGFMRQKKKKVNNCKQHCVTIHQAGQGIKKREQEPLEWMRQLRERHKRNNNNNKNIFCV